MEDLLRREVFEEMDRIFEERRDPLSVVESGELYTRPPRTAL